MFVLQQQKDHSSRGVMVGSIPTMRSTMVTAPGRESVLDGRWQCSE